MSDDQADFAAFASAAMAQASAQAIELTTPVVEAPPPEAPKVEAEATKEPVEAKKEEEKKVEPDWKKAAAEEKAKREARQTSKSNEARLQAQLQSVTQKLARFEAIEAKKDTDPLGALADLGLTYDAATKAYIRTLETEPEGNDEVRKLNEKIQSVEKLLQQQQATIEQRAQAEAVQSFQAEVRKVLEAKADDFELVKTAKQGPDLVREIVATHYRKTATFDQLGNLIAPGEIMETEDACRLAEQYLEEDIGQFKGTKKFGPKVEVKAPEPVAKPAPTTTTISQDMRTGGTTPTAPHGDEIEQLLLLKKTLESQLETAQGN